MCDRFAARMVLAGCFGIFAAAAQAGAPASSPPNPPSWSLSDLTLLSQYGHVVINHTVSKPTLPPAGPINAPPINGFVPQVVFGLTTEQDKNGTLDFAVKASTTPAQLPASFQLPIFAQQKHFEVGIFDTGSQSHLITQSAHDQFDLSGADLDGTYDQPIEGVNGTEDTLISNALGVYATGFANATVTGGATLSVPKTSLSGQWNCPILTADPTSELPNIVGAPLAAQYQTVIRNSQTRTITVGGTKYQSPGITFQAKDTALPQGYSKLTLGVQSVNGVTPDPVYIPSIDDFENFANDPTTPGFWGSFTATATATHTAGSSGAQDFLLDTGAQVTVVSEDTAAQIGFYTGGDNPTPYDFYVDVSGVGGSTVSIGGFYMNQLSITTNGGPITWTHVPVLVLNIPDPRDGVGFIPGVLGMNLFTDRDLILNGGTANPYLAISSQITPQWTATGGGTWSDDTKWSIGSPNGPDLQANFLSSITGDSTITVDSSGFTVGSMKFDNSHRYTIAGPGTITLQAESTGSSAINVVSGSHTIAAPMVLASDTTITVTPAASVLTISGNVDGGSVSVTKAGAGKVTMNYVRAGGLTVNEGTVALAANGSAANVSKVTNFTIAGGATPTATFDLNDNDLIITNGSYSTTSTAIAYARDGGAWDRAGLSSLAARTATPMIKTLGAITGLQFESTPWGGSTFDGLPITDASLLVKFTYLGDADLSGKIDGSDYAHIDLGFSSHGTDWFHGDFNYDGKVDGGDYALIDAAFAAQTGFLGRALQFLENGGADTTGMDDGALAMVREHFQEFGEPYAASFFTVLPEPASITVWGLAAAGFALSARTRARRA